MVLSALSEAYDMANMGGSKELRPTDTTLEVFKLAGAGGHIENVISFKQALTADYAEGIFAMDARVICASVGVPQPRMVINNSVRRMSSTRSTPACPKAVKP